MKVERFIVKGRRGYILSERRRGKIRTLIYLCLALGAFFSGLLIYGSSRNMLSIIAAVLCLPLGLSAVNLIMFMRSLPISDRAYEAIEAVKGGLLIRYELMMTSERTTYPVSAVTVLEDKVRAFSESDDLDIMDCEDHIRLQLNLGGRHNCDIAVTKDLDEFLKMLKELEDIRADRGLDPAAFEDEWEPGTAQTAAGILRSISL